MEASPLLENSLLFQAVVQQALYSNGKRQEAMRGPSPLIFCLLTFGERDEFNMQQSR